MEKNERCKHYVVAAGYILLFTGSIVGIVLIGCYWSWIRENLPESERAKTLFILALFSAPSYFAVLAAGRLKRIFYPNETQEFNLDDFKKPVYGREKSIRFL